MKQRLKSLKRIMRLREQLKRIEELKLARLTREEAELEARRESLINSLNNDPYLHGLFVEDMARSLRRVNERSHNLQHLKHVQLGHVMTQARHFKQAENLVGTVSKNLQRAEEKSVLDGLIEQIAARPRESSLP